MAFNPVDLFSGGENGCIFDPQNAASLYQESSKTTLASVGGPVGAIADQSGNHNDALQATSSKRPLLGRDDIFYYIQCDGIDDFLTVDLSSPLSQPVTYVSVWESEKNDSVSAYYFDGEDNAHRQSAILQNDGQLQLWAGGAALRDSDYFSIYGSDRIVLSVEFSFAATNAAVDGSTIIPDAYSGDDTTGNKIYLFSRFSESSIGKHKLFWFMAINRILSINEKADLADYLRFHVIENATQAPLFDSVGLDTNQQFDSLIEIAYYDVLNGVEKYVGFSDSSFETPSYQTLAVATGPGGLLGARPMASIPFCSNELDVSREYSPLFYEPRIIDSLDYEYGIDKELSLGTLTLNNADGGLNDWLNNYIIGRQFLFKAGEKGTDYDTMATLAMGRIKNYAWDDISVKLILDDLSSDLDKKAQTNTYQGNGGLEGGSEIKGQTKPLFFSRIKNAEPVLVDSTLLLYQVNDGPISSSVGFVLYDKGIALKRDIITNNLSAWAQKPGYYAVDEQQGIIRLGSPPDGRVTVDFYGDQTDQALTFVASIASMLKRAGFPEQRIGDISAINAFNSASIAVGDKTIREILNEILNDTTRFWFMDSSGLLSFVTALEPAFEQPLIRITEKEASVEMVRTFNPIRSIRVGYDYLQVTQSPDELAGAVTPSRRNRLQKKRRFIKEDFSSAQDVFFPQAIDKTIETYVGDPSSANLIMNRYKNIHLYKKCLYRVVCHRFIFGIEPGDIVQLKFPDGDLTSGRNIQVMSVRNNLNDKTMTLEGLS